MGANDGILLVVGMYGGNDGLRMVAPVGDSNYRRLRSSVFVTPEEGLGIGQGFALAPELTTVKSMWDAGQVAIVHGSGYANPNLSHFTSMAYWMSGRTVGAPSSGWVGRWLDTSPADLFRSATIGHSVPLHMIGERRRSIAVPEWGVPFGGETSADHRRAYRALSTYGTNQTGRGPWAKALGQGVADTLSVASVVSPVFDTDITADSDIARKLVVAARLINANLGFRVLDAGWGDFDHHSGQLESHPARMREFDEAIRLFYAALSPTWRNRVTIMTFSEFGRTPFDNASDGTDHGTCHPVMVLGHRVNGGHLGEPSNLASIVEDWDRLEPTTDFRRTYATVIDQWLAGDSATVLGSTYTHHPLFVGGPTP